MTKALDSDRFGVAQTAFRALTQGERREFILWCRDYQEARRRQRLPSPSEREFAAAMAQMNFGEAP